MYQLSRGQTTNINLKNILSFVEGQRFGKVPMMQRNDLKKQYKQKNLKRWNLKKTRRLKSVFKKNSPCLLHAWYLV